MVYARLFYIDLVFVDDEFRKRGLDSVAKNILKTKIKIGLWLIHNPVFINTFYIALILSLPLKGSFLSILSTNKIPFK